MDMIWGYLQVNFPLLSHLTLSILVITQSNADDEYVFSMICKNKTEFRSRLDLRQSLNSILRIKMSFPEQLQSHY